MLRSPAFGSSGEILNCSLIPFDTLSKIGAKIAPAPVPSPAKISTPPCSGFSFPLIPFCIKSAPDFIAPPIGFATLFQRLSAKDIWGAGAGAGLLEAFPPCVPANSTCNEDDRAILFCYCCYFLLSKPIILVCFCSRS